jgi:hypothetical protein
VGPRSCQWLLGGQPWRWGCPCLGALTPQLLLPPPPLLLVLVAVLLLLAMAVAASVRVAMTLSLPPFPAAGWVSVTAAGSAARVGAQAVVLLAVVRVSTLTACCLTVRG